jgi:hypothetical protein
MWASPSDKASTSSPGSRIKTPLLHRLLSVKC